MINWKLWVIHSSPHLSFYKLNPKTDALLKWQATPWLPMTSTLNLAWLYPSNSMPFNTLLSAQRRHFFVCLCSFFFFLSARILFASHMMCLHLCRSHNLSLRFCLIAQRLIILSPSSRSRRSRLWRARSILCRCAGHGRAITGTMIENGTGMS